MPDRVSYERQAIEAILDEALVAHLSFAIDGQPYAIPTIHARVGDSVLFHGSAGSRTLRALGSGARACLTVTLIDGLVLARSAFKHTVNYRSVVVLGEARPVAGRQEREAAYKAFMEKLMPGRWEEVRRPTERELRVTSILKMPLGEASAKQRTGPPSDEEDDYALDAWAGVIPLALRPGEPMPDPRLSPAAQASSAALRWVQRREPQARRGHVA